MKKARNGVAQNYQRIQLYIKGNMPNGLMTAEKIVKSSKKIVSVRSSY